MEDSWSVILFKLDLSTKVSCRLTCKLFYKLLPRSPSIAMFYNYQCIKDGNSRLMWPEQPLVPDYYHAAIESNDVITVRELIAKSVKSRYENLGACIKYDRDEIFKLLFNSELEMPTYYYYSGKTWLDTLLPPLKIEEPKDRIIYNDEDDYSKIGNTSCIDYNNIPGFLELLYSQGFIYNEDVQYIVEHKRSEMYEICINKVENFPVTDSDIALIDDIKLLKYVQNKKLCLEHALFSRVSPNITAHLFKELYNITDNYLSRAKELGILPSRDHVKEAIQNLDCEMIRYYVDNYPSLIDNYDYNFSMSDNPLTLELWNLINSISPDIFTRDSLEFFTDVSDEVLMLDDFLALIPDYYDTIGYILKSRESCEKFIDNGRRFTLRELRVLLDSKFAVEDEFIEFLYNNAFEPLEEINPRDVNYPVLRWAYKKGLVKSVKDTYLNSWMKS